MTSLIPADYDFPPDLPTDIAAELRAADKASIAAVIDAAYAKVDYPNERIEPRAESLTKAQLALATTLLDCSLWSNSNRSRLPDRLFRDRWLGLVPPGPFEEMVDFTLDGETHREPLARAVRLLKLHDAMAFGPRVRAFVDELPIARRYALWGLCNLTSPAPWQLHAQDFFPIDYHPEIYAPRVKDDAGDWAATFLDQLLEARKANPHIGTTLLPYLAAVRAKIPLEQRWDVLLPLGNDALVRECLLAIPAARRSTAVVTWLSAMRFPVHRLQAALRALPHVPDPAIVELALRAVPDSGGTPRHHLRALRKAAGAHADVLAPIAAAEAAMGPPKVLTVLEVRKPTTMAELSPEDQAQLLVAGKRYHGKATRLDVLLSDRQEDEEESLRFDLTVVTVGDAKGKPSYDAWLYRVDAGCVFSRGKTRVVAERAQFAIECKDDKLADALETLLRAPLGVATATATATATAATTTEGKATPKKKAARAKAAPPKK